ncbi:MAG: DUF4348 domain-containing protein [Prevotella sp.]|nr:DUF4348 domain-containing protein [Prevotella sp.]
MRHYFFLLVVFLLIFVSCGGSKTGTATDEEVADSVVARDTMSAVDSLLAELDNLPMPKAADELFDDFVFNFAANRKLQMERILFPLRMVNDNKVTSVDRQQWKMEHFFMHQGYYTELFDNERHMEVVKDTSVNQAVVEKIFFDSQTVSQYHFRRLKGAWMLVEVCTIPIAQSNNASFLPFYHQFASSSEYQLQHIGDEVTFVGPDPDDDFATMEGVITPDTWEAFAPQLPKKMIYNIIYGEPRKEGNSKLFVLRGIANGLELEMTFHRSNGNWRLTKLST